MDDLFDPSGNYNPTALKVPHLWFTKLISHTDLATDCEPQTTPEQILNWLESWCKHNNLQLMDEYLLGLATPEEKLKDRQEKLGELVAVLRLQQGYPYDVIAEEMGMQAELLEELLKEA